jgi:hypothetical protein
MTARAVIPIEEPFTFGYIVSARFSGILCWYECHRLPRIQLHLRDSVGANSRRGLPDFPPLSLAGNEKQRAEREPYTYDD